jgi:hypothetical protein
MKYDLNTAEGRTSLRTAWIEALRSGKYKQAKGKLRARNGAMCCLGVLCEVAGLERSYDKHRKIYDYDYGGEVNDMVLPEPFASALNMDGGGAVIDEDDYEDVKSTLSDNVAKELGSSGGLTELNDSGVVSFKDIADLLEKAPGLFYYDVRDAKEKVSE